MRLHHLRLQAFGPFPGTEHIDFDSLSADGLHLIHGATGAGKTSILDAICFALFAGVPGGRAGGRTALRSDHAAPAAVPEVELDFAVGERRLRVRRSPEHPVPKKRGTGTRVQRGSVQLEELSATGWQPVSTRADEVAQLIGDLLGMGLAQFAQVMLLPQGEFTAFLRAKADDRGRLLERLFDISKFADIERWLVEHRRSLDAEVTRAQAHRAELVSRAQDALGTIPAESGSTDVTPPARESATEPADVDSEQAGVDSEPADVDSEALHRMTAELSARLTSALAEADAARTAVEAARARLAHERSVAALQQQAHTAQQTLQRLAGEAPALARSTAQLDLAERADRCEPAITALGRRRTAHEQSRAATNRARCALRKVTAWSVPEAHDEAGLTDAGLDPLRERALAGTEALAGQPELLRQLRSVQEALHAATAAHDAAAREATGAATAVAAGAAQLTELTAQRETELPAASAHPQWRALLDAIDAAAHAATAADRDLRQVEDTGTIHRDAQRDWARAEGELLILRRARLAGIAAELAEDLVDGQPCPVCGSPAHPHAARRSAQQVDADRIAAAEDALRVATAADQRAAAMRSAAVGRAQATCRTLLELVDAVADTNRSEAADVTAEPNEQVRTATDLARTALAPHRTALAALATALTEDSPTAGATGHRVVTELAHALDDARAPIAQHTAEAASAAKRSVALETRLVALRAEHSAAEHAAAAAAEAERAALADEKSLRDRLSATRARVAELAGAHAECCGCSTDTGIDARAAHARSLGALDELLAATAATRAAAAELTDAESELGRVLAEQQFPDAASAAAAMLPVSTRTRLRTAVDAAAVDRLKASGVLEQPDVEAAVAAPAAEVDRVAAETADAEAAARHTHDAVGDLRRSLQTLERIADALDEHDRRAAPLRERLAVATSLASAVSGSGDNEMRMRLTAYVLAARLETVTSLANERLQVMTSGRYQLEHTDARSGRGKSGLGLQVRDAWTGTARDTGTLSGGESFIASLALALGLGDAVLQAAGGRRLDTLLVDEGFGSLDEDSLEQVLDVLDGLRAGGRCVGIVSHVAELRGRIPSQIRVHKTATGSTLEVVTSSVA